MPSTFNHGREGKETAPGGAAPDKELEDAAKHHLCRAADRLGESVHCWLGVDWRRNFNGRKSDRALSAVCARQLQPSRPAGLSAR